MKNIYDLLVITFVIVCSFCVSSCFDIPQEKEMSYETVKLQKTSRELKFSYSAKLRGKQDIDILPQVDGVITEIAIKEGEVVKKGQKLFVIDQKPFILEVQTAQAQTISAKAQLATAKLNYESNKELFSKKIVSQYVLKTAENTYNNALAAVKVAEAQEAQAKNNLSRCTILSPTGGRVGMLPYKKGDLVGPSIVKPLTVISDNSTVVAYFSLTENDMMEIAANSKEEFKGYSTSNDKIPVKLKLKSGKMYEYEGKIISYSGVVDSETGSISCMAEFPNPEGFLLSGLTCSVIYSEKVDDIMVVPENAVKMIQDKTLVYKLNPKDSTVTATIVNLQTLYNGKEYMVVDGLELGDEIVTKGSNNVKDGEKIKVKNTK